VAPKVGVVWGCCSDDLDFVNFFDGFSFFFGFSGFIFCPSTAATSSLRRPNGFFSTSTGEEASEGKPN